MRRLCLGVPCAWLPSRKKIRCKRRRFFTRSWCSGCAETGEIALPEAGDRCVSPGEKRMRRLAREGGDEAMRVLPMRACYHASHEKRDGEDHHGKRENEHGSGGEARRSGQRARARARRAGRQGCRSRERAGRGKAALGFHRHMLHACLGLLDQRCQQRNTWWRVVVAGLLFGAGRGHGGVRRHRAQGAGVPGVRRGRLYRRRPGRRGVSGARAVVLRAGAGVRPGSGNHPVLVRAGLAVSAVGAVLRTAEHPHGRRLPVRCQHRRLAAEMPGAFQPAAAGVHHHHGAARRFHAAVPHGAHRRPALGPRRRALRVA